jgi:hypothetical protein
VTARRPWQQAVAITLLALYLPTLVPFAVGPLTGSEQSVATYLQLLPIVPAWLPGFAIAQPFGATRVVELYVFGGIATLLLAAGLLLAARRLRRRDVAAACVVVMPLVGIQAHWLGAMLRA